MHNKICRYRNMSVTIMGVVGFSNVDSHDREENQD